MNSLVDAPVNINLIVIKLAPCDRFIKHLAELGVNIGSIIRVIQSGHGPIIINIAGSRFALGHGIAKKIFVKEI